MHGVVPFLFYVYHIEYEVTKLLKHILILVLPLISNSFLNFTRASTKVTFKKAFAAFALEMVLLICSDHLSLWSILTPK